MNTPIGHNLATCRVCRDNRGRDMDTATHRPYASSRRHPIVPTRAATTGNSLVYCECGALAISDLPDTISVRYCSHPDGHAPKDCPDA